jgi:hypothetical protein
LCPWILSHRTRMHPWIGDQEDFILDTHIPQIGEILKGGAASPDVLASGRPPYPAPPNTIPSDKPPQLLRTSEPGTRRKHIQPRQMQSIAWEAIRDLYSPAEKTSNLPTTVAICSLLTLNSQKSVRIILIGKASFCGRCHFGRNHEENAAQESGR